MWSIFLWPTRFCWDNHLTYPNVKPSRPERDYDHFQHTSMILKKKKKIKPQQCGYHGNRFRACCARLRLSLCLDFRSSPRGAARCSPATDWEEEEEARAGVRPPQCLRRPVFRSTALGTGRRMEGTQRMRVRLNNEFVMNRRIRIAQWACN